MPRRNNRAESVPPLDLTPKPDPLGLHAGRKWSSPANVVVDQAKHAEHQRLARMRQGIDWTTCLVPGCGRRLAQWLEGAESLTYLRDPEANLPLCKEHAIVAWQAVQRHRHLPDYIETAEQLSERHRAEAGRLRPATSDDPNGQLYFVRINDLVKVGWTQTLPRRLKEYGAGAELLCHYPGTRDDETQLHRRLGAVRAKGREWYHDGEFIQRHVTAAVDEHGPPTAEAEWTIPKHPVTIRQLGA